MSLAKKNGIFPGGGARLPERAGGKVIAFCPGRVGSPECFAQEEYVTTLNAWDVPFYSEKQRQKLFEFQEDVRPYFLLPKVLDGLFAWSRLFGGNHAGGRSCPLA